MAIGAIICPAEATRRLSIQLRTLKKAHDLDPYMEVKWTKVSPAKIDFYKSVVDFFFQQPELRFRALLVPDKDLLNHAARTQTHDEFYYKMYYLMLRYLISPDYEHRIYLDIKDTRGGKRVAKLHEVLCNSFRDFERENITRVQQIRSHESEILQVADILVGAVGFAGRGLSLRSGKGQLVEHVRANPNVQSLDASSSFSRKKFNLFVWNAQEG